MTSSGTKRGSPARRIEVRRSAGPTSDLPIAVSILVATGVLAISTARPTGTLGLDGRIGEAAHELGVDTLGELVKRDQRRFVRSGEAVERRQPCCGA